MRRTFGLLRGSSGLGWYKKYRETPEAFDMYTKCTPFDWTEGNVLRPKAFFEIQSGNEVLGNLEFELAEDIVPRTVKNFIDLVTGENPKKLTYQGTKFHYVRKNEVIMGGDVEHTGGRLSHAASQDRFFEDENFIIPHTARGLISMASVGVNTNGSQFYISLSPTYHLNGRCMVFGRLVGGEELLSRLEKVYTVRSTPATDLVIKQCGIIRPNK